MYYSINLKREGIKNLKSLIMCLHLFFSLKFGCLGIRENCVKTQNEHVYFYNKIKNMLLKVNEIKQKQINWIQINDNNSYFGSYNNNYYFWKERSFRGQHNLFLEHSVFFFCIVRSIALKACKLDVVR